MKILTIFCGVALTASLVLSQMWLNRVTTIHKQITAIGWVKREVSLPDVIALHVTQIAPNSDYARKFQEVAPLPLEEYLIVPSPGNFRFPQEGEQVALDLDCNSVVRSPDMLGRSPRCRLTGWHDVDDRALR
jgi:hypothetical protein